MGPAWWWDPAWGGHDGGGGCGRVGSCGVVFKGRKSLVVVVVVLGESWSDARVRAK